MVNKLPTKINAVDYDLLYKQLKELERLNSGVQQSTMILGLETFISEIIRLKPFPCHTQIGV